MLFLIFEMLGNGKKTHSCRAAKQSDPGVSSSLRLNLDFAECYGDNLQLFTPL